MNVQPRGSRREDPLARRLPAGERGDQRRPRRPDGHQRRVDPQPGRHRQPSDRRPRRDRRRTWPWRPAARRWRPAGWRRPRSTSSWSPPARCRADPRARPARSHTRLGIPSPGAYDLNAACAGFCYGLSAADRGDQLRPGRQRARGRRGEAHRLDRPGRPVDGDHLRRRRRRRGRRPGPYAEEVGIGPVAWGSAGDSRPDHHPVPDPVPRPGGPGGLPLGDHRAGPGRAEACERAGIAPAELAAFVPHQANLRIVEAIARKLGATNARVADDIVEAGNTSAASIPLALARMATRGEVRSGDPVLLLGFGAGLTYAGQVVALP